MLIFTQSDQLKKHLKGIQKKVGFVPTMGALHSGHLSLIDQAANNNEIVVCSIFVNPTQFNNPDDLEKYPRTVEKDILALSDSSCDILFLPSVDDIYPEGTVTNKQYQLGPAADILEGAFRPGHFQGVAQVVDRLLEIVSCQELILGQKDFQQIAIIRSMAETYHPDVQIISAPIIRAADGLAQSSRNQRLNAAERALSPLIYQTLISIQAKSNLASFSVIQKEATEFMEQKGFEVEYITLIDKNNWEILEDFDTQREMAVLIAAYLGKVRLIDNILL